MRQMHSKHKGTQPTRSGLECETPVLLCLSDPCMLQSQIHILQQKCPLNKAKQGFHTPSRFASVICLLGSRMDRRVIRAKSRFQRR